MHSVKGSWVGQTYALAAGNDSGGKKSRIRLSKEERKTMIEFFIKRYQSLNNGNFPSLNLTHKEVGGSFYTVREIVREIIQENRVLGPGQFGSEEQNEGDVAMDYPLGSIASQPQNVMFQKASELNDLSGGEGNGQCSTQFDWDAVQYSTEHRTDEKGEGTDRSSVRENLVSSERLEQASLEGSSNGNVKCLNVNETDNVHFVNHMQTSGISEESDKQLVDGSPICKTFEADEEPERMGAFQADLTFPTEEVQVETFPLTPVIKEIEGLDSTSSNPVNFDGTVNDFGVEKVKLSNSTVILDDVSSIDGTSDLVTTNVTDSKVSVSSDSGGTPDMIIEHAEVNSMVNQRGEVNLKIDPEDSSYSSPIEDDTTIPHDGTNQISPHGDLTSKTVERNNLQPKNTSKGSAYFNNSNVMSCNNGQEPTAASRNEFKQDEKAKFGKSAPLDRLDLGSWKASKQETNPLLAFFKAVVDAFARIWSE